MLESEIEIFFVKKVALNKGMAIKLYSPSFTGLPDRMVLFPGGLMFFAELKRPGAKPRPRQKYVHKTLRDLGFKVYVIDSKAAAEEAIKIEIHGA